MFIYAVYIYTLPETNSPPNPLKLDGLEDYLVSFWGKVRLFSGALAVSFGEGI